MSGAPTRSSSVIPVSSRMKAGTGVPGIHQRLEGAVDLAAADLHGPDLGDGASRCGDPPVVSRSTTQNVTSDSGVPSSSKLRWRAIPLR